MAIEMVSWVAGCTVYLRPLMHFTATDMENTQLVKTQVLSLRSSVCTACLISDAVHCNAVCFMCSPAVEDALPLPWQ